MVDTCVSCGQILPENSHVCSRCSREAEMPICKECKSHLRLMHMSSYTLGDGKIFSRIFHCDTCNRDWEIEIKDLCQPGEMKQKFLG
jgi:hypothetical protein